MSNFGKLFDISAPCCNFFAYKQVLDPSAAVRCRLPFVDNIYCITLSGALLIVFAKPGWVNIMFLWTINVVIIYLLLL